MGNLHPGQPVDVPVDWHLALRRYLVVSFSAHLIWEILQLPFYTVWTTGTLAQQAFAVLHCTVGDTMIAGLSLLLALALFARATWPSTDVGRVFTVSLAIGLAYTVYSEWLNVSVRKSWAYSDLMPVMPVLGTGLAPLLQWLVVPTLALWAATGRAPWIDQSGPHRRRGVGCPDRPVNDGGNLKRKSTGQTSRSADRPSTDAVGPKAVANHESSPRA